MPGSGGFSVTIAAVDAASAKIDAINKKIAEMRAPAERVQKAVARFADVSGLDALGKGFGEIGRRSLDAFRSVSRIVEPLAAITSALSVAGMARLAFAWGEFGEKLSIASQRIGISTGRLQSLQGGARLAGASAEAMTSGLRTLGDTLTDAVAGRAPEAVVMMNTLGIAWRDASGHARSVTDVLPELADRIAAIKNPALQARVATALLGAAGEQLLPYLRRGRQGMAEYAEEARHYGVINERAAEVAEEFARQQHALGLATEGLTNAIGEALAPVLGPLLHDMAEWIADNRAWIATDIAKAVRSFAGDVRYLAGQFSDAHTGAMTLAGYFAGPWLAAMMLGLGPVTAAIAAVVAGMALIHAGRDVGNPENLPPDSPLWRDVPEKEQLNYRNSPASRKSMGWGNPNPFHWWNPGSWLGREDHLPPPQPAFDPNAPNGVPRTGPVFGSQTPRADVTMDPTKRGFLATLAGPESGGAYDIRNGGSRFSDYSHFPEGIGRGGTSTATGAYQFTAETWKEEAARLGLPDITPANQDKAAWDLAERRYRAQTGRDLETDLKAGNRQAQIAAALGPTWPSLPGGSQTHQTQDQFNAALARNTAAAAAVDQPVSVAVASPANIAGGTGVSPTEINHTVTGDASLRITLGGAVPEGTTLGATTSGDLWGGPPRVERAMIGVPG